MRLNDDEKTVAAMDVLVPGVGEIIGGSRERLDVLDARMDRLADDFGGIGTSGAMAVPHGSLASALSSCCSTSPAWITFVMPFPSPGSGNASFGL